MYPELMQKTLKLKRQIDEYHDEYREWIETSGVVKNPSRFLIWIICIVGASTPAVGRRYLALQNVANSKVVAMSSCYIKKVDGPAI